MSRRALSVLTLLLAASVQADNINEGFEFDAVAPFSIGPPPLTATVTGGQAGVPADPSLVLGGARSWQIPEGTVGIITFDVPARGVFLQSRTEFAAGGEVRIFNVDGTNILTDPVTGSFGVDQIVVGNNPKIERVEFEANAGGGILAVDDIIWIADATPTDITVFFTKPDNDYSNVQVDVSGDVAGGGPLTPACVATTGSSYGCQAEFEITLSGVFDVDVSVGGMVDQSYTIDSTTLDANGNVYLFSGGANPIIGSLPALPSDDAGAPAPNEVILHYIRPDGNYTGWGLHLWNPSGQDWTNFTGGEYFPETIDSELGAVFRIALPQNAFPTYSASPTPEATFPEPLGLIIHKGAEKDPGPDQFININSDGNMLFVLSGINQVFTSPPDPNAIQITGASAHWVQPDTIIWDPLGSPAGVELHYSASASIAIQGSQLAGADQVYTLTPGVNPQPQNALHLGAFPAWTLPPAAAADAANLVRGQLVAVALNGSGDQIQATEVQLPLVLDSLYATAAASEPLGAVFNAGVPTLRVWAPTANNVTANIYDNANDMTSSSDVPMVFDAATGIWSITGDATWNRKYYTYTVNVYVATAAAILDNVVTDPYSVNLSLGSSPNRLAKTHIIDLNDADLKPAGWDALSKPTLDAPEDIVLYELQIRDFSARDTSVPLADRGKYTAFDIPGTSGRMHLEALANSGLTHVHLLPTFDIATVNEERSERVEITDPVEDLCAIVAEAAQLCIDFPGQTLQQIMEAQPGNGNLQQQIVEWGRDLDGFNWGYDPYHYTVPEGSYSTDPDTTARILEFRRMVSGLNDAGLRVIMDVVYNHTNASGSLASTSVLDKVVPGYYHRLNQSSGIVLGDSCCQDTASEHAMMEKLMVDSVVTWARDFKVDGFRFDLMGFHTLANMEMVRDELQALTVNDDGVDGSSIYVYGEGWNFGDVASDRRFIQATQANMAGTGIGTFNDRLRDGVRGGGPFDSGISHIQRQGFASGLYYDPNATNSGSGLELTTLLNSADWIRIGMTGNLANYPLETASGAVQTGAQINYNGQPTGYTLDPQETINYVEAHDNETLWDIYAYKHPTATSAATRVRAQVVASSTVLLGQGIAFVHAGQELLRSKSMDRDSFDSGDWYNRLDFTGSDNNFAVGEPRNSTNSNSIDEIRDVLLLPEADAASMNILDSADLHRELMEIRASSRLFRLPSDAEVIDRVSYHNTGPGQIPGVIVQRIDGCVDAQLTPDTPTIVTVINATDDDVDLSLFESEDFTLHSVQQDSVDPVVRTADHSAQGFSVPARTAAVFEAAIQYACAVDDADADGVLDSADNCIWAANASQLDSNGDGIGNACDTDLNNDCLVNAIDLGIFKSRFFTPDADADFNGDGIVNVLDLGVLKSRFFQNYTSANPSGVANDCAL